MKVRRPRRIRLHRHEHLIETSDPGIRLHLREKCQGRTRSGAARPVLLMVHGQSLPSPVCFDFPLPGYSWMDYAAARGYDVFALTLRGYGMSTRPPEMERDPASAPPAVRGRTALRDVEAAVRFIRKKRGAEQLSLLGWAQGTMLAAAFAAAHPRRVEKVVLFSPLHLSDDPAAAVLFEDPEQPGRLNPEFRGAWRWVTEKGQQWNWSRLFPRGKAPLWREPDAVRAYWAEQLRYDPEGARRRPHGVRIPNGLIADHYDRTHGQSLYKPAEVKCPALLIRGEHDLVSSDQEAQRLFGALARATGKRYVIIGDATHFVQFEKRRDDLFNEVQNFLEE